MHRNQVTAPAMSGGSAAPVGFAVVSTTVQTCYRHPDRRAGVICQRCDRPICPDCMRQASVGFHCPECTKTSGQKVLRGAQLRTKPVVTHALIALNLAVFVAGIGSGLETKDRFIVDGGLVAEGFNPLTSQIVGVAHGEWWRVVTSGFLHANVIHIGFNMLVLYQLGNMLEPALGRLRFGIAYAVALLSGALGVLLIEPHGFTVGASGAVFGLMGVAVAAMRSRGIDPFATGLGGMILLNLVFTFTIPGISIGGHVGGLIGGFLCGHLLVDVGPRYLRNQRAVLAAAGAMGLAVFGAALLIA